MPNQNANVSFFPQALDNKTLNRLETAVAKSSYVGQGKKLKVTNEVCDALWINHRLLEIEERDMLTHFYQVNPEILGGLVVNIGDRTIDLSVSSKIAKMNKLLTDTL